MNPLSLLPPPPPPPSNFFSDLPSLPPSSPHHGTPPLGCQQPATNEPGRTCTCPRALYRSSPHRPPDAENTLLLTRLHTKPAPPVRTVHATRSRRACFPFPLCSHCRLFFLPLPLLKLFPPTHTPLPHLSGLFLQPSVLFYPRLSARTASSGPRAVARPAR